MRLVKIWLVKEVNEKGRDGVKCEGVICTKAICEGEKCENVISEGRICVEMGYEEENGERGISEVVM